MKAYKLEILVIDHDHLGEGEIRSVLENTKYPNYCINPQVMRVDEREIGEWHDDHPLNNRDKVQQSYLDTFR